MKLRSLHVRHFKSLDDVRVDFTDPITVLVGPNAVGKSNVVDTLRFVRDAVTVDLEHAMSARGGIKRVRQFSRTKPFLMTMELAFEQDFAGDYSHPGRYEFSIQSQTDGNFLVSAESATWHVQEASNTKPVAKSFQRNKGSVVTTSYKDRPHRLPVDQLALGIGTLEYEAWPLISSMYKWSHAAPSVEVLRRPASADPTRTLAEDGHNWASMIRTMKRSPRGREAIARISEAMAAAVPGYRGVSVSTVGNYLVPTFSFEHRPNEVVEFDPEQLSDGTLRAFGILLALYQEPAPDLLIIEEPELTIHPGALGVLADAFKEVGEQTQIILTTHSPQMVDHFLPEQIRVVTMDGGKTQVAPIRAAQVEAVKQRLLSMGEFMQAEGLQPEPVV